MQTVERPETKPALDGGGTTDKRKRHIVERIGPSGSPLYRKVALCGEEVEELVPEHNGDICQGCVDEMRRRGKGEG